MNSYQSSIFLWGSWKKGKFSCDFWVVILYIAVIKGWVNIFSFIVSFLINDLRFCFKWKKGFVWLEVRDIQLEFENNRFFVKTNILQELIVAGSKSRVLPLKWNTLYFPLEPPFELNSHSNLWSLLLYFTVLTSLGSIFTKSRLHSQKCRFHKVM